MDAPLTIQEVIDRILAATPYDPAHDTVDIVKIGDPGQPVAGIVTTFLASYAVIERAIATGDNLIITHEPIFYNHRDDIDVAICGEINEWDTSEYVRDAIRLGQNKALIVVGHAPSEEAGMAWQAEWLRQRVAGVPITHIPSGNALRFV